MTSQTKIQWTDSTWNVIRGCARVSPGCESCYAERTAHRFNGTGMPYEGLTVLGKHGPRWAGRARFVPEKLSEPLHWKKPRRIFVNSMSDLFHDDVTNEQIAAVFGVMAACPQHTFQVLTKRADRMLEWFAWAGDDPHMQLAGASDEMINAMTPRIAGKLYDHFDEELGETDLEWPLSNVWLGVSCEDQQRANERIPLLVQCPATVHFVSAEPLLGPIDLRTEYFTAKMGRYPFPSLENEHRTRLIDLIDWLIVGGESGPGARPCNVDWIHDIVRQCKEAGVACFVKQLGRWPAVTPPPYNDGELFGVMRGVKDRKGGDIAEFPDDLRVREFPEVQP